ncbi:MAG: hypothetical protein AAF629_06505 [Chloroflexota bacterium]
MSAGVEQLRFLAEGGEHVVFQSPRHQHLVIKVHKRLSQMMTDAAPHHLSASMQKQYADYHANDNRRWQQLKLHFGRQQTLPQRKSLQKWPKNGCWWHPVFPEDSLSQEQAHFWVALTFQRYAAILHKPQRLSISAGYAELRSVETSIYERVTPPLLLFPETWVWNQDDFLHLHPNLRSILVATDQDKHLHESLSILLRKIIHYGQTTGEILDIASRDNLVLFRRHSQWTYLLADALYPFKDDMMARAQRILGQLPKQLTPVEQNVLLNVFNFIRVVNGLAHYLRLNQFLYIFPKDMRIKPVNFLAIIQNGDYDE